MAIRFILPHRVDTGPAPRHNWLWYSHCDAPKDRPVVSNWQDPVRPNTRMAAHYFLTDFAHNLLSGGYALEPVIDQHWELEIQDRGQAAAFKLVFM